jgi:hypothetical protein
MKIYTRDNKRESIGTYTKGIGKQECAIRDGVWVKSIDNDFRNRYHDDAYVVDFYGNIFYSKNVGETLVRSSDDRFIKAKEDGFHVVRNLTDNEIFAMKKITL